MSLTVSIGWPYKTEGIVCGFQVGRKKYEQTHQNREDVVIKYKYVKLTTFNSLCAVEIKLFLLVQGHFHSKSHSCPKLNTLES